MLGAGLADRQLPAGDSHRGDVHRRLDAIGDRAVVGGAQQAALDTAHDHVDVPTPEMSAPIATNISHRSTTSSRTTLSIVVTPSASTAAVTMFSVAPTLGNGNVMSRAAQAVGRRLDLAVAELERPRPSPEPGRRACRSAGAEVVPAGHRQADPAVAA